VAGIPIMASKNNSRIAEISIHDEQQQPENIDTDNTV
jgi:hypothetical protein